MPDDQTLATILAVCELMGKSATSVDVAVTVYEKAIKDVIEYRRSRGETELGGLPEVH